MRAVTLKLLAAAGVAALVSFSAQAADLPEAPPPAPAYVPEYSWTGMYVGAHAGYGWGEAENTLALKVGGDTLGEAELDAIDVDGAIAGGQIGYNYQIGSFVIGAEADLSWSGIEGEVGVGDDDFGASLSHDINWIGTVRGRAGVALDRFLVYATGGVAFADVDTTVDINTPFGDYSKTDSNTHVGWTAGAGVEAFITPNLTAKVEYLYVDLGEEENVLAEFGRAAITTDTDLTAHMVRGGINYKFSW